MILKKWDDLPDFMQCDEVREYYDVLNKKRLSLVMKRLFDIVAGIGVLIITAIPMGVIAIKIKTESNGKVLYCQTRVTQYGKAFKIHKFRTMVQDADKLGTEVTVSNDSRITKTGHFLRKYRLDELPQVFDVLNGNMSFVGTRPETAKYVSRYKRAYYPTLLLPAGITSLASLTFKNESEMLNMEEDVEEVYINKILPEKMKINLESIKKFSLISEIGVLFLTLLSVFFKKGIE